MTSFCKCGSLIIDGTCSNRACPDKDPELLKWIIEGVLYRFRKPIRLSEAQQAVKNNSSLIVRFKAPENSTVKPYTG